MFLSTDVYVDYIDFYISHFIVFKLNVEEIINNLIYVESQFQNRSINNIENKIEEFKNYFNSLLRNLNEEELSLFNRILSGTNLLQSKYTININIIQDNTQLIRKNNINEYNITEFNNLPDQNNTNINHKKIYTFILPRFHTCFNSIILIMVKIILLNY